MGYSRDVFKAICAAHDGDAPAAQAAEDRVTIRMMIQTAITCRITGVILDMSRTIAVEYNDTSGLYGFAGPYDLPALAEHLGKPAAEVREDLGQCARENPAVDASTVRVIGASTVRVVKPSAYKAFKVGAK